MSSPFLRFLIIGGTPREVSGERDMAAARILRNAADAVGPVTEDYQVGSRMQRQKR